MKHLATGTSFLALIPFVNTLKKSVSNSSGVSFELDGSVTIKSAAEATQGQHVSFNVGLFNDADFFSRYYEVPDAVNPFNGIKLALPGALSAGSKFNTCLKDPQAARKDECRDGYADLLLFHDHVSSSHDPESYSCIICMFLMFYMLSAGPIRVSP